MEGNTARGHQVKSNQKFSMEGYWVNRGNKDDILYIDNVAIRHKDKVPDSGGNRLVYIYFGKEKPTEEESEELINNTPNIF